MPSDRFIGTTYIKNDKLNNSCLNHDVVPKKIII